MNKTIIAFLLSLICANVFAGMVANKSLTVSNILPESNDIQDVLGTEETLLFGDFGKDYESILGKLEKTDAEFVKYMHEVKNVPDDRKLAIVRSYVAKKTFDYYLDFVKKKMEEKSKQTNRKIKTYVVGSLENNNLITSFELDRGKLDTPECHVNGDIHEMETCYYPDGFEEFYISIDEYRNSDGLWEKGFVVSYDDIEKGINIYCSMDLSVSEFLVDKTKDNGDVKIDNYVFQEDYSESHVCDITDYADNQRLLNSMVYNAINGCEDDGTRNGKPDKDCIQVVLPAALVTLFDIQRGYSHERRITTSKYE